ncbi:hypothetical protein HHK36_011755 [Tetracentron sinense]|uniref:Uncharacterized protein n=1 Tax=Tetracentron sinense TaxID=13715 RepID=A0A835DHL0_TETSI|nr:hypothetical protein HHK36_011755 [Tetracentron sinense]
MSACCRRISAGASASKAVDRLIPSRIPFRTVAISPTLYSPINQRQRIVLRSPGKSRRWIVESINRAGISIKSEEEEEEGKVKPCSYALEEGLVEEEEGGRSRGCDRDRTVEVMVAAAITVVFGVGNRVLYKLALVPLKHYPFFLAQLATFGYVLVYFSILYFRYHAGIVTDEMLSLPKTPFLAVGLLEALGAASGMAAGAILSGASIPILSQTFLVWQLLLSVIFLGRRYKFNQILGCFLVAVGVIITVASGSGAGLSLKEAGIFWTLLMITSFLFQAADTVLKEIIFQDAAKKLKGGSVDLFVVNSYGSAFQALFICLLLPFLSKLWGIPFNQLPNYLKDGAACFLNIGSLSSGCEGAPLLPLLFVIVNMGFNISLLHLLKISSAVVSCLASTFSVPLSVYAFTLPLPYIGVASSLPTGFVSGVVVLVTGLLIYAWTPSSVTSTNTTPTLDPQQA